MWTNTQSTFLSTIHIRYFIMMMMTTETHKIFLSQIKIFQISYTKPYFVSIIISNLSFSVWIVTMYYFTVIENCHININYELIKFVEIFSIFFSNLSCKHLMSQSFIENWLLLHIKIEVFRYNELIGLGDATCRKKCNQIERNEGKEFDANIIYIIMFFISQDFFLAHFE